MNEEEIFYSIALTQVPRIGLVSAKNLIRQVGNATDIFKNRRNLKDIIPDISSSLVTILDSPAALKRAEQEMDFIKKNKINCFPITHPDYPSRLKECSDAPVFIFSKGDVNLNTLRIISIVGTRNATEYGKLLCSNFISELKEACPDILVVSGLAYGIDICSHRSSVENDMSTVGVLAHGLDRIYPSVHRKTAIKMLSNGGLVTEFLSRTVPDKFNFISRNRIIAGLSDATIVVESAQKGGSLITADLANAYERDCFAFPGAVGERYSKGCNNLIKNNKATLITSAQDFLDAMNWEKIQMTHPKYVEPSLFLSLSDEEKKVVEVLRKFTKAQINTLVVETDISINSMTAILFQLELKGVVKALIGGVYQLLVH